MKPSKLSTVLIVGIVLLAILNLYQFSQIDRLEGDNSYLTREVADSYDYIEDLKQPNPIGIEMGFVGENFAGIVCNTGQYTAYNVKLVLSTSTWSYKISLGNIDGEEYVEFNEYVPTPESDPNIHTLYHAGFEWYDSPQ